MTLLPCVPRLRSIRRCLLGIVTLLPFAVGAQSTVAETWPAVDIYWQPAARQRTLLSLSAVAEREGAQRDAVDAASR